MRFHNEWVRPNNHPFIHPIFNFLLLIRGLALLPNQLICQMRIKALIETNRPIQHGLLVHLDPAQTLRDVSDVALRLVAPICLIITSGLTSLHRMSTGSTSCGIMTTRSHSLHCHIRFLVRLDPHIRNGSQKNQLADRKSVV